MPHTVKVGETLSKIAKANKITLAQLLDANPRFKADPNLVRVGDVLNIPGEGPPAEAPPQPQPAPTPPPPPTPPTPPQPPAGRVLGKLSEQFETSNRGAGTVSGGVGDPGGVSYGSYQMTSKTKAGVGGTVKIFVTQADFPFRDRFAGLTPGTPQFSAVWKELAKTRPAEFQAAQHDFIKRTHFDPLVAKILREDKLNVLTRSATLQDVIWSTSVQHGAASSVPHRALAAVKVTTDDPSFDRKFIEAIYAERGRKDASGDLANFKKASKHKPTKAGLENRFKNELRDALKMLKEETGQ